MEYRGKLRNNLYSPVQNNGCNGLPTDENNQPVSACDLTYSICNVLAFGWFSFRSNRILCIPAQRFWFVYMVGEVGGFN